MAISNERIKILIQNSIEEKIQRLDEAILRDEAKLKAGKQVNRTILSINSHVKDEYEQVLGKLSLGKII